MVWCLRNCIAHVKTSKLPYPTDSQSFRMKLQLSLSTQRSVLSNLVPVFST